MDYLNTQTWQEIASTQQDKFNNTTFHELFAMDFDARNSVLEEFYNKSIENWEHDTLITALNVMPIIFEQTAIMGYIGSREAVEMHVILGRLPYSSITEVIKFFGSDKHLSDAQIHDCEAFLVHNFNLFDDLKADASFAADITNTRENVSNFLDSLSL